MPLRGRLPMAGVRLVVQGFARFHSQMYRAERLEEQLGEAGQRASHDIESLNTAIFATGFAATAAGASLMYLTQRIVAYGSQVRTLEISQKYLASAFDTTVEAMQNEVQELENMYVPTQQAYEVVNRLTMAEIELSNVSEATAATLNLATTAGVEYTKALESMVSWVIIGRKQNLRNIGITAEAADIYEWWAEVIGTTVDAMGAAEKAQARLDYIIAYGERSRGAYAEYLENLPGQLSKFRALTSQVANTLSQHLEPALTNIMTHVNRFLELFLALPEAVQKAITYTVAISGAFLTLAGTAALVFRGIGIIAPLVKGLPKIFMSLLKPLGKVIAGFKLWAIGGETMAGATVQVTENAKQLGFEFPKMVTKTGVLTKAFVALKGALAVIPGLGWAVIGVVKALGVAITTNFGGLRDLFSRTFGQFFSSLWKAFKESIPWIRASISLIFDAFKSLGQRIVNFAGTLLAPFRWLDREIRKITGQLAKDTWGFEFDAERFFVGAASMMGQFAAGLIWGFNKFVLTTVIKIVNAIADFFGRSMPTRGPLSTVAQGGISIVRAWLDGMSSVSLDQVTEIAENVEAELNKALWNVQDELFKVRDQLFALDSALWPFQKQLRIVQAEVAQITIPLERQKRELERQLEYVEKIAEEERHRAEQRLRELEDQREKLQEIIDIDQERLDVLNWEIFIEERRNDMLDRVTSARLLNLKAEQRATEDQVAINEERVDAVEEEIDAEEDRLEQLITQAEAQAEALREQIEALDDSISAEKERVQLARENLELAEARQIHERLAAEEAQRYLQHEQSRLNYLLSVLRRLEKTTAGKAAAEEDEVGVGDLFPTVGDLDDTMDKVSGRLDEMKEKMLAAFKEAVGPALDEMYALFEELGEALERLEPVALRVFRAIRRSAIRTWKRLKESGILVWEVIEPVAQSAWEEIKGYAKNTYTWIEENAPIVWEAMSDEAQIAWEKTKGDAKSTYTWIEENAPIAWSAVSQVAVGAWNKVSEAVVSAWNKVSEATVRIWNTITQAIRERLDAFIARWRARWETIKIVTSNVWTIITTIFKEIGRWIRDNLGPWVEYFGKLWSEDIWPSIKIATADAWKTIKDLFKEIGRWFTKKLGPWVEYFKNLWVETIWPSLREAVETFWKIIKSVFKEIGVWFNEKLGPWVEYFGDLWTETIWPSLREAAEKGWKIIKFVFSEIGRWINENLVPWVEYFKNLWVETVWPAIQSSVETFWDVVEPIWVALKKWFEKTLPKALEPLQKAFETVMEAIEDAVKPIKDLWDGFVDAVKGFWDWITDREFEFKFKIPDLPSHLVPGSPLPIHEAWEDFAKAMQNTVIKPQIDTSAVRDLGMLGEIVAAPEQAISTHHTTYQRNVSTTKTYNVDAHYAHEQSEASIKNDLEMMVALS